MPNFKFGFSLIELMVVITLFGLAASVITTSYLSFEKTQRVKGAALQLKSDLRLVQNKATSGDKGPFGTPCNPNPVVTPTTLGGWYLRLVKNSNSYSYAGICANGVPNFWTSETKFSETATVNLPRDMKIRKIYHSIDVDGVDEPVAILFRPIKTGMEYFRANDVLAPPLPAVDFFSEDASLSSKTAKYLVPSPSGMVTIEVSNLNESQCYLVKIEATGDIFDEKPAACS